MPEVACSFSLPGHSTVRCATIIGVKRRLFQYPTLLPSPDRTARVSSKGHELLGLSAERGAELRAEGLTPATDNPFTIVREARNGGRERMIHTSRLLLRWPEPADAQALLEIHQDPEVLEQGLVTLTAPPGGIDVALRNIDRMLRHWRRYGYGQWSVVERATEQVVGCVGLRHRDELSEIELGWIIRRSHWGDGFATEAAQAAIAWAWQTTTIDHIISLIRPDDARSMRVAEKSGQRFEREGIEPLSRERMVIFGMYRPARLE